MSINVFMSTFHLEQNVVGNVIGNQFLRGRAYIHANFKKEEQICFCNFSSSTISFVLQKLKK